MMDMIETLLELNTAMGERMIELTEMLEEIIRLLKKQEPSGGTGQKPGRVLH